MAWKLDNPLYSLADDQENKATIETWQREKHGGLWESNNRLPYPVTFLIGLIIVTAFLVTKPIWGQRPSAELYAPMVELMDSPEVQQKATKEEKMAYLTERAMEIHKSAADTRLPGLLERHPISWEDLQLAAPHIREIKSANGPYGLESYTVVGDQVVLGNFEGSYRPDGLRERTQPWWDKGYTIDLLYVSYFVITMVLVCKRLPHFTQKPDMSKAVK